jgi:hypothetical protein
MTEPEWEALVRDLTCRARSKAGTLWWSTPTGRPEAKTVHDIVLDAVADILSPDPRNRWDPDRMQLSGFLWMVVWGDLRLAAGSAENRRRIRLVESREGSPDDVFTNPGPSAEEELERAERDGEVQGLVRRIREQLASRDGLLPVFDLWMEGNKPAQIADTLDLPVERVYAKVKTIRKLARQRFRRDVTQVLGGGE